MVEKVTGCHGWCKCLVAPVIVPLKAQVLWLSVNGFLSLPLDFCPLSAIYFVPSLVYHFIDSKNEQHSPSSSGCESASELTNSLSTKKRIKWTIDLHEKFLECVNQLGGPMKATPKGILKLMGSHELTIYHVKSHLQKYRSLNHVHSTQETKLEEEEIHTKDSNIQELMRLQDEVGQNLQEQLKMQRELYLLVEEQNQQLQEMIKYQKGKIL